MSTFTVAMSEEFFSAFSRLPKKVQGKTADFLAKFRANPRSPGINYEKISNGNDSKIWSVRIDDTYRGIVVREEGTGTYILLWVDHHDDAYAWARRKKCMVHPETGAVQIYDVAAIQETTVKEKSSYSLFGAIADNQLLFFGIPEEQIPLVRAIDSEETLISWKHAFPEDAYEVLEYLANGFSVDEVTQWIEFETEKAVKTDDLAASLGTAISRKSFVVVDGEEELRLMLAEPLEKWRVFLHPSQRKLVDRSYNGPVRVLGGAGTGKTVVAMHRAKYLASLLEANDRILFTTFTTNLVHDIRENLRKICTMEELKRIEVINLDSWVARFMREQGFTYRIVFDEEIEKLWERAIIIAGNGSEFPVRFYMDEWSKVIVAHETYSKDAYMRVSRTGRGTRLDRAKRAQIWNVVEEFQSLMKDMQVRDTETAMYECRQLLEMNTSKGKYASIIVDEAQDLSMNAFRLLRSIAGPERENDLFIVGDSHQRIYGKKVVLSRCGVNIRGRSSRLRLNYRTTEEIRKFAFGLLKGVSFDDLDEGFDDADIDRSLMHGIEPTVKSFTSQAEEIEYLDSEIQRLREAGSNQRGICVVARTKKILAEYQHGLNKKGVRTYEIKRSKGEDRHFDGIRVATMHRVKGLEFKHIFVVAANNRIIPLQAAIQTTDEVAKQEALVSEKSLLYVALTRAQKSAYVTGFGKLSSLLSN